MSKLFSKSNWWKVAAIFALINIYFAYRIGLDNLLTFWEHLAIAFFGAFIFMFAFFRREKNKHDAENLLLPIDQRRKFDVADYWSYNWEDWVWTFIFTFPIVWYMPDVIVWAEFTYGLPAYEAYYLGAGPLSILAGFGFNWLINKYGN